MGDTKKLSVLQQQGAFVLSDTHRPPVINTYDMRYDLTRTSRGPTTSISSASAATVSTIVINR